MSTKKAKPETSTSGKRYRIEMNEKLIRKYPQLIKIDSNNSQDLFKDKIDIIHTKIGNSPEKNRDEIDKFMEFI